MSAAILLQDLGSRGVRLEPQGSSLVVEGPTEAVSEELLEQIRILKSELLLLLVRGQVGEPWGATDWQAYFEERAAIREHDGGLPRWEAERLAFEDAVTHWLCCRPAPPSDPRQGCVHCGSGDQPGNILLAVLASGGHAWVHDRCWSAWHMARRRLAEAAIRALGLTPGSTARTKLPAANTGRHP